MNTLHGPLGVHLDDLLRRAAAAQRLRLERSLRPFGLSSAQYLCIKELAKRPGQSNAELARGCDLSPQTMTVVVTNLEKRELVKRVPHEENLRVLRLSLTRSGEQLAGACEEVAGAAIVERLRFEWPKGEARAIVAFLQHVATLGE
jgi:DNA-binding MarR family transcriptional regulator